MAEVKKGDVIVPAPNIVLRQITKLKKGDVVVKPFHRLARIKTVVEAHPGWWFVETDESTYTFPSIRMVPVEVRSEE